MTPAPPTAAELRRSVGLFLLTTLSVWGVYAVDNAGLAWPDEAVRHDATVFAASLMTILLAHELGHYVVARIHGFETSLPGFIPLPLPGSFGTMGAVIRLRSFPPDRAAVLEMGAAGPLAGAAVAFALLWYGVPLTRPGPIIPTGAEIGIFNDPLIVKLIGIIRTGAAPGRYDTYHPAAFAGWVGCFLTANNLIPVGQLDGGHVFNAMFPKLARPLMWTLAGIVGLWGLLSLVTDVPFFTQWLVWGGVIAALGAWRPLPVPAEPAPGPRSRAVAFAVLVLFVLTFMPIPIQIETYTPP
jgi:membrane-associated protease RseP (regulator of RpoE activity)